MDLDFIRNGGETRRYHTWPVLRQQNVAEHSFHVAMLCAWLCKQHGFEPSQRLLMAALTHDLAEHQMGDIPSPTKRRLPDYGETTFRKAWGDLEQALRKDAGLEWESGLTQLETYLLKLADAAEGALYCIRERAMGNLLIREVFGNFRSYVAELAQIQNDGVSRRLVELIDEEWERVDVQGQRNY